MRTSYSSHVKCLISHRALMKKIISYDVPSLELFNLNKFQVFSNTFICDEEIYSIIIFGFIFFFQILKLQTQKNLLKTFRIRKVPLNLIHRPTPKPAVLVPRRNLRQNLRRCHLTRRKTRNQNSEKPEVILQDRVKEVHRSENDRPDVVDSFQKNTLVPQM